MAWLHGLEKAEEGAAIGNSTNDAS